MNKKLPYEEALEQQLRDLPLPDQDASWQKMQALLDEKDRRRPFLFFSTPQGKSLLSLLLVLGFLVVMHAIRQESGTVPLRATAKQVAGQDRRAASRNMLPASSSTNRSARPSRLSLTDPVPPAAGATKIDPSLTRLNPLPPAAIYPLLRKTPVGKNNKTGIVTKNFFADGAGGTPAGKSLFDKQAFLPARRQTSGRYRAHPVQAGLLTTSPVTTALQNLSLDADPAPDSMQADKRSLPLVGLHETADGKNKTSSVKLPDMLHRSFFIRAGVGVQQQIPVGGQKQVAINLNGNRNLLADYIPSFFLQFEKEQRWYVQAEFSWASPKLVKGFSYSRQTRADSAFSMVTTNLLLKKVFYRELPLSFHYYLRPRWSAGVGATYGWFHGAITEKQTATQNLLTQASAVNKQIVPIERYTDSFLYRSHTYLMLQTNYQWKSLSLGLRFSGDVQPYIKYTLPDGTVADKRNWSLELLVRLGLWKSGKF